MTDRHPLDVYLWSLGSARSQETAVGQLRSAARLWTGDPTATERTVEWWTFTPADLIELRARMISTGRAASSANLMLSFVRGVVKAAVQLGLVDLAVLAALREVDGVKHRTPPAGQYVPTERVALLLGQIADGPGGDRDRAIIACLRLALRRDEVAHLKVEHVQDDGLHVTGKGRVGRVVPLNRTAAHDLDVWIDVRRSLPGAPERGWLFCPCTPHGEPRWTGKPIGGSAIGKIIDTLCRRAGVESISPHDFRRTFVSDALDVTDTVTVQRAVGHASPTTTARYDRRGERAGQALVDLLPWA